MSNIESKSLTVWGPSSLNIYANDTIKKTIMIIGDIHYMPEKKQGKSLIDTLEMLINPEQIMLITEGCSPKLCPDKKNVVDSIDMVQKHNKNINFQIVYPDVRMFSPIGKLEHLITIFVVNTTSNVTNKILAGDLKNILTCYKKIVPWKPQDWVKNTMSNYINFEVLFNSLPHIYKKNIIEYINQHLYKGDKNAYIQKIEKAKKQMLISIKNLYLSYTNNIKLANLNYYTYMKGITNILSISKSLITVIYECYILMLIFSSNLNQYIIHVGEDHAKSLGKWIESTTDYKKKYQAQQLSEQLINIEVKKFT
jgi:hypothetical protein